MATKYIPIVIRLESDSSNAAVLGKLDQAAKDLQGKFRPIKLHAESGDFQKQGAQTQQQLHAIELAKQLHGQRLEQIGAQSAARQAAIAQSGANQITAISTRSDRQQEAEAQRHANRLVQVAQQQAAQQRTIQERTAGQFAIIQARQATRTAPPSNAIGFLGRFSGRVREAGESIQAAGYALTGLTTGLLAVGAASIKSTFNIDASVNVLKAFTGSAEAAEKRFRELVEVSRRTPGLTTGLSATLDAQLRVAGATEQAINRVLPAIGRLNAVSPLGDPQRFAQNLIQLITQNFERADLKELVGQSPLAGQLIKEVFNVDSPTNSKAIREQAQKLGLTTVDSFFNALAKAAAENQSLANVTESLQTRFAKLVDRVTVALRPLGTAIVDALGPLVEKAVPIIERLSQAFADLPSGAKQAIIVFGGIVAAIGPVLIAFGALTQFTGGIGDLIFTVARLTTVLKGASAATAVAGAATTASLGPVGIVLGVLAAGVAAFGAAWITNFGGIRDVTSEVARFVIKEFKAFQGVFTENKMLLRELGATFTEFSNTVKPIVREFWEFYRDVASSALGIVLEQVRTSLSGVAILLEKYRAGAALIKKEFGVTTGGLFKLGIDTANPLVGPVGALRNFFNNRRSAPRGTGEGLGGEEITRADFAAAEEAQRLAAKTGGGGGGRIGGAQTASRARELTEAQKLAKELAEVNREIKLLQNVTSREFGLKLKVDEARDFRSDLEKIVDLRRTLGEPIKAALPATASGAAREVERLTALKTALDLLRKGDPIELGKAAKAAEINKVFETFARLSDEINSRLPKTEELTLAEAIATGKLGEEFAKLNPLLQEQIRQQAQYADGVIAATNAQREFSDLQNLLNSQREVTRQLTAAETLELELQKKAFKDLSLEQVEALREQAKAIDSQNVFGRQVEEARRQFERLNETVVGIFQDLYERGPKAFFESVVSIVKRSLARIAAELTGNAITGLLARLFNVGGRSATGGGFNLGSILGGNAGGSFLTGGFAGGNPAGAILSGIPGLAGAAPGAGGGFSIPGIGGGGSPLGGLLGRIPGLGGLFGGTSTAAAAQRLGALQPIIAGGQTGLGAPGGSIAIGGAAPGLLGSLGAGGLLAGGGLLGALAGGKSPVGQLLGGIGGTLGLGAIGATGIFGGGIASALPAFFSNPFTAIIAGGLLGGAFLFRLFKDRDLKSYRKLIKGEYAIDVKDNETLKQIREIGKQHFGKDYKKHQIETIETIRHRQAKEVIGAYAEATDQAGNGKLLLPGQRAALQDPFDPRNQFIKREFGGPVVPGRATLVGERRPEIVVFGQPGHVFPSINTFEKQLIASLQQRASSAGFLSGSFRKLASQLQTQAIERSDRLTPVNLSTVRGGASAPSASSAGAAPARNDGGALSRDDVLLGVLVDIQETLAGLRAVPPDHVIEQGLAKRPGLATKDVLRSYRQKTTEGQQLRREVLIP